MTDADNLPPFDRVPLGPPPPPRIDLPKVDDLPPLPVMPPSQPARPGKPPADKPKPMPTPTPVAATPAPKPASLADTARDLLRPSRKLVAVAAAVASLAAGVAGVYLTGGTAPAPKAVAEAPTPATAAKPPVATIEVPQVPDVADSTPPAVPVVLPAAFAPMSNDPPAVSARTTPAVPVLEPINSRGTWADRATAPSINPNNPPPLAAPRELPLSVPTTATLLSEISLPGVTLPEPPAVTQVGGEAPAVPAIPPPAMPPVPSLPPKVETPPAPADKPQDPVAIPVVSVPTGLPDVKPVGAPPSPFSVADPKPPGEVKPAAPVALNPVTLPPTEGRKPLLPAPTTAPALPPPGAFDAGRPADPQVFVAPKPTTPPAAVAPLPVVGDNPFKMPDATPPPAVAPFPPVAAEQPRPVLAAPLGAAFLKPAGAADVRTDFDVELHDPKPADTYETISKLHYGDVRYAAALRAFNRNQPLADRRSVEVPPAAELKRRYGATSDRPVR